MEKKFLVSVANAYGRNPSTGELIFAGRTNLSSALDITQDINEIRAGRSNQLVYTYSHSRGLKINIEQANYSKEFIALNLGQTVQSGAYDVLFEECIQVSAGSGTLTKTPVGIVSVQKEDGTITNVTPSGTSITVPAYTGKATVVYKYNTTVDRVTIGATTVPNVITLILDAEVRSSSTGAVVERLQIELPSCQITGNYNLSFTPDGVSTEKLELMALAIDATTCNGDTASYGTISWIPVTANTSYAYIIATPALINPTAGTTSTAQISVFGVRNGVYGNVNLTTATTYAKMAGGASSISVNASTGVVSWSSPTSGNTATIECTYNGMKDFVVVTAV